MRWIKCKENLPDKDGLYLITHLNGGRWQMFLKTEDKKWYWQPNPYSVCGDGFIDQWLDESIPTSIEQEAERLYPYGEGKNIALPFVTVNGVTDVQRSAHITAARMYMGEIERVEAQNLKMREMLYAIIGAADAEGWIGMDATKQLEKIKKYATDALKNTTHG